MQEPQHREHAASSSACAPPNTRPSPPGSAQLTKRNVTAATAPSNTHNTSAHAAHTPTPSQPVDNLKPLSAPVYLLPADFDGEGFSAELQAARKLTGGPEFASGDAAHLHRIILIERVARWSGNLLAVTLCLGVLDGRLPWPAVWLVTALAVGLVAFARATRWTVVAHHVSHGGYDKLAGGEGGVPGHFRRGSFGRGLWRRCCDWLDWLTPEAWNVEHNKLHHYHLSEVGDPDLVECNFKTMRATPVPAVVKLLIVGIAMLTWRWLYYAPNALRELYRRSGSELATLFARHTDVTRETPLLLWSALLGESVQALWRRDVKAAWLWVRFAVTTALSLLPAALWLALPALVLALLGATTAWPRALALTVAADVLTNVYTFMTIVCNHSGSDLYRFDTPCAANSPEFFLRAIYASANFHCGTDTLDLAHGWLNYQVEHHIFPSLTPLHYRRLQPHVAALCRKYDVPYVQEAAVRRTAATVRVMCGFSSMGRATAVLPPPFC